MRPFLSLVANEPDLAQPRRRREPCPVERLLRDGLEDAVPRPDVPLLLDHLGDLDRWDQKACRGVWKDVEKRSSAHPSVNERFVTNQIELVGSGSAAGLRVRDRWLASRAARFIEHVAETYRCRGWDFSSTRRAYYRALFVACLMRANPGPTDDALSTQSLTRRSGP